MNSAGLSFSLMLHVGLAGSLFFYKSISPSEEKSLALTAASAVCTIPLEVTAVSEFSQAPISKPKVANPREKKEKVEKKREENAVIENVLPDPEKNKILLESPSQANQETKPFLDEATPPRKELPKIPKIKPARQPKPVVQSVTKKSSLSEGIANFLEKEQGSKTKKHSSSRKDDFTSILRNVDRDYEDGPSAETPITDPNSTSTYGAERIGAVAMSVMDRIRRLLEASWVPPRGAYGAGPLVIAVRITLNPNGTVRESVILPKQSNTRHPAYEIAAESALRAIAPFKQTPLTTSKVFYKEYKTFDFRFIPK